MPVLKAFSQLLYFSVELAMFVSLAYVGFHANAHPLGQYLMGLGLPLLAIILWGLFAAPRSAYRLEPPFRALFALVLFGVTAFLLYRFGLVKIAVVFGLVALLSQLLALSLKQ